MFKTKIYLKLLMSLLLMAFMAPPAQAETVTVCVRTSENGTTSSNFPIYGLYLDTQGCESQMIYPASLFENIDGFAGCTINSITFTATADLGENIGNNNNVVKFGETTASTISTKAEMTSNRESSSLKTIFTGQYTTGVATITFNNIDWTYEGGNIIIDTYMSEKLTSGYSSASFYGESGYTDGTSAWSYNTNINKTGFLPEMIIDFTPASTDPYKASVSPTSYDFGTVIKNGNASTTITLKNRGTESFKPTLSGLSSPFSATMTEGVLASGETREILITYSPTAVSESDNGTLNIDCGEAGTLTVTLTGSCNNDLTICDGTTTNGIAPIFGSNYTANTVVRMLYPAEMLTLLVGKKISKVKFYSTANAYLSGGKFQVSVAETSDASATSENTLTTDGWTIVNDNMSLTANATELEIEFAGEGYEYNGGNLLIETKVLTSGSTNTSKFYGVSQTNNTLYTNKTIGNNSLKFLPKATFSINETGDVYGATVDPTSIEYGSLNQNESSSRSFTLTNTGTGGAKFTPVFSITGANADMFNIDTEAANYDDSELKVGDVRNYNVIFTPTAEGNFTATLTITMNRADGQVRTMTVALTGTGNKALYDASVTPEEGQLDFGKIIVGRTATKKVTITSLGSEEITPTVAVTGAGFAADYTVTTLELDGSSVVTVTFTPTAANTLYNGRLTITAYDGKTFTFSLKGEGKDESQATNFDNGTYTWPINAAAANQSTSYYSEIATDPDQMIALMRAVYMDQSLPGNKHRGYTSAGVEEGTVVYPAIGKMTGNYDNPEYTDFYGWNIPSKNILTNDDTPSGKNYKYFDPADYKPESEGLTLLLVELNDGVTNASASQSPTSYESLRSMFKTMFKSVRIVTSFKNSGSGEDAGTLFKIDCDRMNRFFFLGKGRLRQYDMTIERYQDEENGAYYASDQPGSFWKQATGSSSTSYTENENGPFYQMFEQFSPVILGNATYATDIYQTLVTGTSYPVKHECESVPWATSGDVTGHEFNLYGRDSYSNDCQDVRDLMFFVPEYRMKWWPSGTNGNGRDKSSEEHVQSDMYVNYNQEHLPTMGLFVINQKVIQGEKQTSALKYDLTLSWESNLKTFLPGSEGTYSIYQVITNADGTKTYQLVAEGLSSDELTYPLTVDMDKNGKELTFVIRGQDADGWLTLQYSNERSYYIPGYENKEQLKLAMNADSYYSRFDAQNVKNNYSNSLTIDNAGTNLIESYLTDGDEATVFHIWRAPNGVTSVDEGLTEVATATVTSKGTNSGTMNLMMVPATQNQFTYGYHANPTSMNPTFTWDDAGVVSFSNFSFYDNFSEAIPADNSHPNNYVYYVTFTTATPFVTYVEDVNNPGDLVEATSTDAISNTVTIPVYKTAMTMAPLTRDLVNNDATHAQAPNIQFTVNVNSSARSEILRYDAYRWADSETEVRDIIEEYVNDQDEEDVDPAGQANNESDHYTTKMNADYTGSVSFTNGATTAQAPFEDNYLLQNPAAETYTYVPVVELLHPAGSISPITNVERIDYNTYGAPLQTAASALLKVSVDKPTQDNPVMSTYEWSDGSNKYAYYTVTLTVDSKDLPEGYNIYKVRAWRKIDSQYLGEEAGKGYESRASLDANGEYKFEDINYPDYDKDNPYKLGSFVTKQTENSGTITNQICRGTFGARKLGTKAGEVAELPMEFVVRIYFTKEANLEDLIPTTSAIHTLAESDADGRYYIAETTAQYTLEASSVVTAITGVYEVKEVAGVKYYNMMGAESDRPFQGVNIVVTRYTDGTTSTSKVLK